MPCGRLTDASGQAVPPGGDAAKKHRLTVESANLEFRIALGHDGMADLAGARTLNDTAALKISNTRRYMAPRTRLHEYAARRGYETTAERTSVDTPNRRADYFGMGASAAGRWLSQ